MYFFFNDTATTEIYTLSLHDALPILPGEDRLVRLAGVPGPAIGVVEQPARRLAAPDGHEQGVAGEVGPEAVGHRPADDLADRKSTRLNSSHANISYAVFCLKKKNTTI